MATSKLSEVNSDGWADLPFEMLHLPFVDLSIGDKTVSGLDMPDVQLDALCEIILSKLAQPEHLHLQGLKGR